MTKAWLASANGRPFACRRSAPVHVINDADSAGLAEVRDGEGRGRDGVVIVLTFGTGIGSGFFVDGELVAADGRGR